MARPIQCTQVSFVSTSDTVANVGGVQRLLLRTTADVFIDFDQPTATTQSYKILAANTSDTEINLTGGTIQNVYVRGASGSGTLFMVASIN